jgi:hypothetical protein
VGMDPAQIDAELARIATLPPLERAAAAEALEARLRTALDEVAPDQRTA